MIYRNILCPKCGGSMSTANKRCPNCGFRKYGTPPMEQRNKKITELMKSGYYTLNEVGDKFGITRERVRQIYKTTAGTPYKHEHGEKIKETRNSRVLKDFTKFCEANPELRFWQALYAWVGAVGIGGIWVKGEDPFYWEGKLK